MTEMSPAEVVFFAALERATAAERVAYLDTACAGDPALRSRVEKLLAAHPQLGGFLEPRPADGVTADAPAEGQTATFGSDAGSTADFAGRDEHVGAILGGKYKLIEEIGEGGMGSVYMAQQTEPVKRAVAVKVIKAGMDSKAVLARFEAERQALAMMDHPNIAKVLDAGTTEGGRPYFVMELVKGVPITQYCDERKHTPRQRLELFVPVCAAIQHAHQKGVIHRDIKPSNVLVALYDDKPVPKVIDFGVAKAAGQTLTDKTLMTGFGAVVGTPEYMSPEQASLNNLDIDTRSDVYSLGVLLYELLTGSTPVDRKSLGKAALLEILRIVREVEAPRPSAKLSTIDTLPSVAANRGTEPKKLSSLMKGELDWVLLKALEKDRTRRYDTANGLARDIQRYLADEIVEARPPSAGYRLKKFVRRHKGQVVAASLVLFALLAGIAGTTVGLIEAKKQEREADTARQAEADRAEGERLAKEEVLRQKAALEGAMIETKAAEGLIVLGLRESLRDLPRQRFQETPARPVSAERIVDGMAKSLDQTITHIYDDKPLIQARIRLIMAGIFDDFDLLEPARQQYEMALRLSPEGSKGVLDEATVSLLYGLSDVLFRQAKYQDAVPMLRLVAEWHRNAEGGGSFHTRNVSNRLAESLAGVGQTGEAMRVLKRALGAGQLAHGEDDDTTLESMAILGRIHSSVGEWDEAESQLQRALEIRRRINTPEYPPRLRTAEQLGLHYLRRDKPATAAGLFRECLAVREKNDPDDWTTFNSRSLLGEALLGQKKYAEAEPLLLKGYEGLKAREKTIPPQASAGIPEALDRLVELYTATKKLDEAKNYRELRAKYPPELAPPTREKK